MTGFSPRYDAALALAARQHRAQVRKGTDLPYSAHVVHVSVILLRYGFDEDLAIAGLLHDVVEDSDLPLSAVQAAFGQHVADMVAAVTEQKRADGVPVAWEQRKAEKLAHLRQGGPAVAALKAADALHNARTTAADIRRDGPAVWARFNRSPEQTVRYYRDIAEGVRGWLGEHPLARELTAAVDELAVLA